MRSNRRDFIKTTSLTLGAAIIGGAAALAADAPKKRFVAMNQYCIGAYFGREGVDFGANREKCFAAMKEAGLDGLEPTIGSAAEAQNYGTELKKAGLEMRSLYTGANLHDEAAIKGEIDRVVDLGRKGAEFGLISLVINPAAKQGKTDAELRRQARAFNSLGGELKKLGIKLAFHYHTTEMEFGAREFHSIMCNTDPANLSLCFDTHWSFRASGNSEVAVFDHAKLYGKRVSEFHLRQSKDGIWTESFQGEGDIDYPKLAAYFKEIGSDPLVVLEQAPENGTPKSLSVLEILKQSADTTRKIFP